MATEDEKNPILEQIIRAKAAYRLEAKAKSWPEKALAVERMRAASSSAKEGMRRTRLKAAAVAATKASKNDFEE